MAREDPAEHGAPQCAGSSWGTSAEFFWMGNRQLPQRSLFKGDYTRTYGIQGAHASMLPCRGQSRVRSCHGFPGARPRRAVEARI